jgi:hypothetical protein
MKELIESLFQCNWKSYKTFESSGRVRSHTVNDYQEFDFDKNKILRITDHSKQHHGHAQKAQAWSVEVEQSKQMLSIQFRGSLARYEVITINHTDMVLKNLDTQDKVFFAKTNAWKKLVGG